MNRLRDSETVSSLGINTLLYLCFLSTSARRYGGIALSKLIADTWAHMNIAHMAIGLCILLALWSKAPGVSAAEPISQGFASSFAGTPQTNFPRRKEELDTQPLPLAQAGQSSKHNEESAGSLAVVYPDIGEPYRSVFSQMIAGIEDTASVPVRAYPVRSDIDAVELSDLLRRHGTRGVIALGRQGMRATSALDSVMPVVVGGVLSVPERDMGAHSGIALTPDPGLLFGHLKNLVPGVRRITVIFNPQQNDRLIRFAKEAARTHGLDLIALEARDLASAARLYETAFASSEGKRDAIWLPHDAMTVDEAAILPLVLRESWNRGVPVFSSNFLHAKRGALFALYPNNIELGKALAAIAHSALIGEMRTRGLQPLRQVHIALNLRTAKHLSLQIGYQQQRKFDTIFPEP